MRWLSHLLIPCRKRYSSLDEVHRAHLLNNVTHSDCLPILRALETKSVDLLLTDPPYGISIAETGRVGSDTCFTPKYWDSSIPCRETFGEMLRVARRHVIWGGNYFSAHLPSSRCWLVWNKSDGMPPLTFADCELAWTSANRNAMVFNCRWRGFVKDSRDGPKLHPTQKPLALMKWCMAEFSRPGDTILDPFLGSGTVAVAAIALDRNFIGIERDIEYVVTAKKRITAARGAKFSAPVD